MPQAAAHILFPLIILSLFRDYYLSKKGKRHFPLHYVLIGGIAGIIPDLDFAVYAVLGFFNFSVEQVHRTYAHTIFLPLLFLFLGFLFHKININGLGRHKLKLKNIFYVIAFGSFIHLILDGILHGHIEPFLPLSNLEIGLNLFSYLPDHIELIIGPSFDAGLLIIYLIYLELKHKISDFI